MFEYKVHTQRGELNGPDIPRPSAGSTDSWAWRPAPTDPNASARTAREHDSSRRSRTDAYKLGQRGRPHPPLSRTDAFGSTPSPTSVGTLVTRGRRCTSWRRW
jgi:hypothetical protein